MAHKYVKRYDPDYIEKRFVRSKKHYPYSSFTIQFSLLHLQPSMIPLNLFSIQFSFCMCFRFVCTLHKFCASRERFDICAS